MRRLTSEEDPVAAALHLVGEHGCAVLIKGGHEEGDALADALIETDNMTSWQGQRIDTTSTHGTGCTLASAIALFLAKGATLADAVARAREFVRVALARRAGPGRGSRADGAGGRPARRRPPGPRLNQVTLTVNDYAKSVALLSRARPQADRRQPGNRLRPLRDRPAARPCRSRPTRRRRLSATTAVYLECDDLDAQVDRLARLGVPFEHGPRNQPWMWREARLRDPSGNIIFLYKAGEARRFPPWRMRLIHKNFRDLLAGDSFDCP